MGRGTTFSFFLSFPIPHKEELKTGSGSERPPLFASSGPRRVLVVDDVATNRLVATNYLTELGHHPVAVSSGEDALKLYSSTQEAPFDLILLDLHMPGLSGSETAQRIRELKTFPTKKVPVVALTADTLRQDLMISHGGPFDEWLDKPLRIKDLELLTGRCGTTPSPTTSSPTQVDSFWLSATELDSQHLLTQYEDEPTIREMLLLFYEESEQLLTDYADALASSNSQSLKRAAHALKGSLYNAGALRLSACAEAIEHDPSRSLASPIPTVFMAEVKLLRSQLLANLTPPSNADVRA
jgi:CheY-like chemotaxis protein